MNENIVKDNTGFPVRSSSTASQTPQGNMLREPTSWIGQGTIPTVKYPDISRPGPAVPERPPLRSMKSSSSQIARGGSGAFHSDISHLPPPFTPPPSVRSTVPEKTSRSPSPEKKGRMLTTLRPDKNGKRPSKSRDSVGRRTEPPAASKAAGLAWDSISRSSGQRTGQAFTSRNGSTTTLDSSIRTSFEDTVPRRGSTEIVNSETTTGRTRSFVQPQSPPDLLSVNTLPRTKSYDDGSLDTSRKAKAVVAASQARMNEDLISFEPDRPSLPEPDMAEASKPRPKQKPLPILSKPPPELPSYRHEYPPPSSASKASAQAALKKPLRPADNSPTSILPSRQRSPQRKQRPEVPVPLNRRPVAGASSPRIGRPARDSNGLTTSSDSGDENTISSRERHQGTKRPQRKNGAEALLVDASITPSSTDRDSPEDSHGPTVWEERVAYIQKHLPKGVDENAAKQIFNEIVVKGDEVHWSDVAGLEPAKTALKEAVVYPFLRPDLFMGLREPARGMLLFGPPGTGKTMLARAVATESRSTFFAISASSLTSKWLGESEKLVRALFSLAKALAPSIIFVDEIDSLLSSRGGSSEHESTRRIKTEFLIQWSDLQRAAAGKEQTEKEKKEGDASRVLVLAATNLPWAIDEAARRRFVRRQYIPLPEGHTRSTQLKTLLSHQKHNLNTQDIAVLVELTEGNTIFPYTMACL